MYEPKLFRLSTAVYCNRGGEILVLKRERGAMTGTWFPPGGAIDDGESPLEAAARELMEETGLEPASELSLLCAYPMHIYGADSVQLTYACDVAPGGEVVLSDEHSAYEWMPAETFRDRHLNKFVLQRADELGPEIAGVVRACRLGLDAYIAHKELQAEIAYLRSSFGF